MIGSGFLKRLAARSEAAVGLDVGSGSLKMAEVSQRFGKLTLKRMAISDVPPHVIEDGLIVNEPLLVDALQRMASRHGFSGSNIATAIGGRSLFIREVSFPKMADEELRQAIHWDLEKYVPFSPEQLYFDFWVIGPGATDVEIKVLLVAVPKEVVDTLARVLKRAGLKPVAVDIEPLAIHRTLTDSPDCMLIDSGANVSQVTLFQKNSPVFTRNIPIGGNQFTETLMEGMEIGREAAEVFKLKGKSAFDEIGKEELGAAMQVQIDRVIGDLAGEVRRTLEYYQVQNRSVSVSSVFLTGGGAKMDTVPEKLSEILELPVVLHDPLSNMEMSASFNRQYMRGIGPQMAVAVGLAMRSVR